MRAAGVTAKPVTDWVTQQARNLSMELADQATAVKFFIRDRDATFTTSFDAVFVAEDTRITKTPVRSPHANATCERVVGTFRRECLGRALILDRCLHPLPGSLVHHLAGPATAPSQRLSPSHARYPHDSRACSCTPRGPPSSPAPG